MWQEVNAERPAGEAWRAVRAVMALLSMGNGRRWAGLYDRGMDDDRTQIYDHMAELEELAAILQTKQQRLERLRLAAQAYLDRPDAVTRGRLDWLLEVLARRSM